MKSVLSIFFVLICFDVSAQVLRGRIIDSLTKQPIPNAVIASSFSKTFTQSNGVFFLSKIQHPDSLKISSSGYQSVVLFIGKITTTDTLLIMMRPAVLMLNQVTIKGFRDYRADSIKNRMEFRSAFNYKAPALKDVFIGNSNSAYVPYSYNQSTNNATQLVNINLLSLIALIEKDKTPEAKLQKTLLRDEEAAYVDHVFSKEKVGSATNLHGDSLQAFMDIYRPGILQLKKMTDYDLIIYIRSSYKAFVKNYHQENTSLLKQ